MTTLLQSHFLFNQRKFDWEPKEFPPIEQVNEVGKPRVYKTPDGKTYESVSSFLGRHADNTWLKAWREAKGDEEADRISKNATDRGTSLHKCMEDYLANSNDIPEIASRSKLFRQLKPSIDMRVGLVYAQECRVYSNRLMKAGTLDLLAQWKAKNSVIDWKTSTRIKKEKDAHGYLLQGTLYSIMVQELSGFVADQIVIVIATEASTKPTIIVKNRKPYVEEIMDLIRKDRGALTVTNKLF